MSSQCISRRDAERILSSQILTFNHGRITYKYHDVLFRKEGGTVFNTNVNSPNLVKDPVFEDINYPIEVVRNGNITTIKYPDIRLYIKVVTDILPQDLEVFSFENLIPLTAVNQNGNITLSNGSIYTVSRRWTYNWGTYPKQVGDDSRELSDLFLIKSSTGEMLQGTSMINILPESSYDNVYAYFNTNLTSNLTKISSTTWRYKLPILKVTFGDNPVTTYTFYFKSQGMNYVDILSD